jgi:hypothetical protein
VSNLANLVLSFAISLNKVCLLLNITCCCDGCRDDTLLVGVESISRETSDALAGVIVDILYYNII